MTFLKFLMLVVPCLISVAFFTLIERKILGLVGYRLGPYKVSYLGFLQPIGDAAKLMNKEINFLSGFSFFFYYLSSFFLILSSIIFFFFLSFFCPSVYFKSSLLLLFLILGLNSLGSILVGWSAFNKFSLLGSLRSVSQLISYEVLLYFCFFIFMMLMFSFDLSFICFDFLNFFLIFSPLIFFIWLLSVLAELNRAPFDFSEGESELVSGFNVDFGSSCFTLIFLAEYGNIFSFMLLSSFLFIFKSLFYSLFFYFFVVWVRSVLPRYRFDKLMGVCWKVILPQLSFFVVFFLMFLF